MNVQIISVEANGASNGSVPSDRQLQKAIQELLAANKQIMGFTFVPGALGGGSYKIVAISYQQESYVQLVEQEQCLLCVAQ